MPFEEAVVIIKREFAEYRWTPFFESTARPPEFNLDPKPPSEGFRLRVEPDLVDLQADAEGQVTYLELTGRAVNYIFDVSEMGADEFSENFIDAYKIPELKPTEDIDGWYHVTNDGTRVTISVKKGITLQKVLSREALKDRFN